MARNWPQARKKPRRRRRRSLAKLLVSERLDARRQSRQLARDGVPVENAFGGTAHQLRLGGLERLGGDGLVAGLNGEFDLLHEGTDTADAGTIDFSAPHGLAVTFLC